MWYGVVWRDVWYGVVWRDVWYGVVGIVRCGVELRVGLVGWGGDCVWRGEVE